VDNTAKTRRPQPRSNTKNDRVSSTSKSSCIKNKEVKVEENLGNLLLSKNKNICHLNQCLISVNHDVCLLNYVNDMNSRGMKQKKNVSINEHQKKQTPKFKKPTNVGLNERLATPKPSKPRFFLRWSPTGRFFDLKGKIIASTVSESQSVSFNGDNACTSNPLKPKIKRFPNSTSFLGSFWELFTLHVAAILGFGDLQWVNILITRVYFVEGLGYNLFSVGQFCDSDLESLQPRDKENYRDNESAPRTILAAQAHQVRQTLMTSTSIADTAPTPTNASSQATNFPKTSQDVDGLKTQHAQQLGNQAPLQSNTVANNVSNAMFDENSFFNPFANPSASAAESSSSQYVDPSNMHTFYQPYPHE
nr:hypothetical protein [Tanacetum cinerariifolium]